MKYGEELVAHMSQGYSFKTFAAVSGIKYSTLLSWAETNDNFKKFKQLGEAKSQHYWETIGIAASQGQLKKTKSEKVVKTTIYGDDGQALKDGEGKPAVKEEVIERDFENFTFPQSAWMFVMKSRFGYRDDGADHFNPDNPSAGGLKKFQLAYNLKDQPYVVKESAEPGQAKTQSTTEPSSKEAKTQGGVNGDAEQQSTKAPTAGAGGHNPNPAPAGGGPERSGQGA